jgi:hypothetical protein
VGEKINAYRLSAEESEEKSPLAGPKHKWEGVDLIIVAHD